MRVIIPSTVGDAQLVSTNAVEVAPALYNSGTTYAMDDQASVSGSAGLRTVYKSLQAGNVGHTPAAGSVWWTRLGTTYQSYDMGTTYAALDRVIDPAAHKVYESIAAGNVGNVLTDTTKWRYISATNSRAMFDLLKTNASSAPGQLTWKLRMGSRVDAVSLHGLKGLRVDLRMDVGGSMVYSDSLQLVERRQSLNWFQYWYNQLIRRTGYARFNLPPYSNADITITVTATSSADAECSACVVGVQQYLGALQYEAESDVQNYSTVERDFDGGINTMTPRRNVPSTVNPIWADKYLVDQLRDVRTKLGGRPAAWSGLDDSNTDGYFATLLILGYYTKFTINTKAPSFAVINLQIEEI